LFTRRTVLTLAASGVKVEDLAEFVAILADEVVGACEVDAVNQQTGPESNGFRAIATKAEAFSY
jgi:hypothetical protein